MSAAKEKRGWWPFGSWRLGALIEAELVTSVPIEIAVQKLRGFIADHGAKIERTDENQIYLELTDRSTPEGRRAGERATTFAIELDFCQEEYERTNSHGEPKGTSLRTKAKVTISPRRDRDRRREATTNQARKLLRSLKAYLMAKEDADAIDDLSDEYAAPSDMAKTPALEQQ